MLELREFAALSIQGAPGTQKVTRTMTTPTAVTRRQFTELGLGTNQERKTRGGDLQERLSWVSPACQFTGDTPCPVHSPGAAALMPITGSPE